MGPLRTGILRIYLGAAPGVGKTVALADEGHRRMTGGSDVVVVWADDHGRPDTRARLAGLPGAVPEAGSGSQPPGTDIEDVVAGLPDVALVDDLGRAWDDGGVRRYRWQEAARLLDAGIDVIGTLDVGSIESMADVVAELTGRPSDRRVPDAFVARAGQVELVDVSPETLRHRLAQGAILRAEELDTETGRLFDPDVLAALRSLTVSWMAGRLRHDRLPIPTGLADGVDARERVMVALSGAPDGERLVRRAARLAARVDGDLVGVVVVVARPDPGTSERLAAQRQLLEEVGGAYQEVQGGTIVDTLLHVARAEGVTQLVVGASPRSRFRQPLLTELVAKANGIDVHVVGGSSPRRRHGVLRLPGGARQGAAATLAAVLLPVVTAGMAARRDQYSLSAALLAYVVVVVAVTSIGGALVGFGCAVAAFLCANFFFTEPLHTFTVNKSDDAVILLVFLIVTAIVSVLVSLERRRATEAEVAGREAEAVAEAAAVLAQANDPVEGLVAHLSRALGDRPVVLQRCDDGAWSVQVSAGGPAQMAGRDPAQLEVDPYHRLRVGGDPLPAPLRRLATAVASQLATAIQAEGLRQAAERDRARMAGDAYRTALLRAVSHDLRTPLTAIKTSVSSLLAQDVSWSEAETGEFLDVIDAESDRLERLIANLLDMSRLQSGGIHARMSQFAPGDVVVAALATLAHLPPGRCQIVLDHDDSVVDADPALLERVVANLVANADRAAPSGTTLVIRVGNLDDATAQIQVIDRGPGIPAQLRSRALEPFSRLQERSPGAGIGLGLSIVDGLISAMGGDLVLDDTPGGGLTATVRLARARQEVPPPCPRQS